jgi:hypothetical protein
VDVTAQGVRADQPQEPQDEQHDKYCPKHEDSFYPDSRDVSNEPGFDACRVTHDPSISHRVDAVHICHTLGIQASFLYSSRLTFSFEEAVMQKDELLKADLLSEIVLLGTGVAILVAFVMVLVAALASTILQ